MVTATQPRKNRKTTRPHDHGRSNGKATGKGKPKHAARARTPRRSTGDEAPERSSPPMAEIDADVLEFIEAIDRFKKMHARPFPSWSEVLRVVRELGYRRA